MRRLVLVILLTAIAILPASASRFGVQVGAFREFERAERVQEALEDAGYTSYVSEENGWKRVRIGPYAARSEATAEAGWLWPFLVARFGPLEFPRSWVVEEDREAQNAPVALVPAVEGARFFSEAEFPIDATAASAAEAILAAARSHLGVPYRWGGTTPDGFDCSGFIQHLFARAGYVVPRQARNQFRVGEEIEADALRPGDLVFFSTYARGASHVGIYLGGGDFIHASSGSGEVTITPLTKRYYQNRYLGARRVLTIDPEVLRQMTRLVNR